jgi:hypothetical protein
MIIKRFTADLAVDGIPKRVADKCYDVPAKIVTWGRIIEGRIDIGNCRASAINDLEQPISADAAGSSEPLIE